MDNPQLISSLQALGRRHALASIRPELFWLRGHSSAMKLVRGFPANMRAEETKFLEWCEIGALSSKPRQSHHNVET